MKTGTRAATAGVLMVSIGCAAMQAQAAKAVLDWPVYNGSKDGDHYSALTQINRGNVKQLEVAWSFDTGEKGGIQSNPLVVEGTLYAYTPALKIVALDAATGALKWKFDSGIKGTQPARGIAYWTGFDEKGGKERRLLAGVMNYLYCLDAETGQPIASFGEQGRVDLRKELRGDYTQQSIALTTPGVIYKNLIIVGGRNPETHPAPPGDVRAFDVRTGKLVWSFHTIPHPGEPGAETWPADAWKTAGAANNWAGMALDEQRGVVYVPTGSAVMDFYGGDRVGDDLYANTLLALDAATGKRLWHFQGVHHDIWDRDFPSEPVLFTLRRDGKATEALAQTTKQGYVYVFDRISGKPLFPIHELPYPASTVPGEAAAKTQPKPDAPEPFARQRLTEAMLTERTPEAHAWAVKEFRALRSDGQFLPFAVGQQTVVFPGFDGGAEWGGPAIDRATNILYVNANEMAWLGGLTPAEQGGSAGAQVYQSQCAMCHGMNRAGAPPTFPSLVDVVSRLGAAKVTDNVKNGNGRMPSFPNLDDARLTALLEYLRTPPEKTDGKEMAQGPALGVATTPAGEKAGAGVYADRCAICHGDHLEGIPPAFPMLVGLGNRYTRKQVVDLLQSGKGAMPPMPDLTGPDLEALLRYLGVGDAVKAPPANGASGAAGSGLAAGGAASGGTPEFNFTGYRKFLDPDGYPAVSPPWGTLSAIDLETGKYVWKIPLGEYPDLARSGMMDTGSENYGGPIVTAGGLVFIGATVYDRKFRAFDSRTGDLLWETELPFAGVATPATYMIDGRQYVVIAASGGRDPKGPAGGEYVAFALPK